MFPESNNPQPEPSKESEQYSSQSSSSASELGSYFKEILKFVAIAVVIVVPVRLFVAQPFIVSGSSMYPTFKNGQYLIVDEISYDFHKPERGDVIVFHYPKDPSKYFIKRVIGLPGETVDIRDGHVYIKNAAHPNGFELSEPYVKDPSSETMTRTLGQGEYFMMGDNRAASSDSRVWGPLPANLIVGRTLLRLFPVQSIKIHPGEVSSSSSGT
ncbi:MAG TPA: signal peptidase I [Candidatus Paceibacterota bacterium]|nr:signal peptidase I [Candidatus Paceibacterota bacterium]